jgi:hypothetical protein
VCQILDVAAKLSLRVGDDKLVFSSLGMFYVWTLVFYDMFVIIVYFVFVTWGSKN